MRFDPMTGEPIQENQESVTGEPMQENQESVTEEPMQENQESVTEELMQENQESVTEEPMQENQEYMAEEPMQENPGFMAEEPEPKKKGFFKSTAGKVVIALAIVAVIACGAVAIAFSGVFSSEGDKVLKAIENTLEDKGDLLEGMDGLDITDEYTLGVSVNAEGYGVDVAYLQEEYAKQFNGNVNVAGVANIDFIIDLNEKELQAQVPYLSDKVFSYNYTEENTGFLMESMESSDIKALNKMLEYLYNTKANGNSNDEFYDTLKSEYKNLEFESVADAKFEVDGKDRTCEGYETVITKEDVQSLLDAMEDVSSEQYEEMEKFLSDIDPSYTSESYSETFDEARESVEEMPDITATFYIYDKKLACIELEVEGEAIQIQFLGGDRRMQNICILDEYGTVLFEVAGEKDGTNEIIEFSADGETLMTVEYDSESGDYSVYDDEIFMCGNIEIERDGITLTIDEFSEYDEVYDFEGTVWLKEGAEFEELEGDKFDVGNASESEIEDLMTEINDSLY